MTSRTQTHDALIALGANLSSDLGGPAQTLAAAIARLPAVGLRVSAVSRFFETPCFPAGAGPDYVNAALQVRTELGPQAVLDALHGIEADLGRVREQRWGQRVIDLDLIAYGDRILPDLATFARWRDLPAETQRTATPVSLILPHPRLQDRAFVLVPLRDIAPDWCHPVSNDTVLDMLADLPHEDRAAVVPL